MKKNLILFILCFSLISFSQTIVTIDPSVKYQTIRGFGSSDAWNANYVGQYWENDIKNEIAVKLFDKSIDSLGNPKGIGLSRWRFNIGAGSQEQGVLSNIDHTERRVECFLDSSNIYDWTKQIGQQWFLSQAKLYGVENIVGFVNSPPFFYTINGRANSSNLDNFGNTNLISDHYDDFTNFLVSVLKHFEDEGLTIDQISPINEPQYNWNSGQEGCPWKNIEVKNLVDQLNDSLLNNNISTKILLSEAGKYNYLYEENGDPEKSNQIVDFFNPTSSNYLEDNNQVLKGIAAHSYWSDEDDNMILTTRENIKLKANEYGLEVFQTEYCLLSNHFDNYLDNSLFLAKIIHADLEIAGVSIWDYWTSMERERWGQKNRFYLIRLIPQGGDYSELTNSGSILVDKNLWALGNFSRFIRPGYVRINTTGANDLSGLMCSSYISPDSSKIVSVFVNMGTNSIPVIQNFQNLPEGFTITSMTPYITDSTYNLSVNNQVSPDSVYQIKGKSITTFVIELSNTIDLNEEKFDFSLYPNPSLDGIFKLKIKNGIYNNQEFRITDSFGREIKNIIFFNLEELIIDLSKEKSGVYFCEFKFKTTMLLKN